MERVDGVTDEGGIRKLFIVNNTQRTLMNNEGNGKWGFVVKA